MASHCGTSLNELINVKDLFKGITELVLEHQNTNGTTAFTHRFHIWTIIRTWTVETFVFPHNLCTVYRLAEILHLA